jgi:hypothetical protein
LFVFNSSFFTSFLAEGFTLVFDPLPIFLNVLTRTVVVIVLFLNGIYWLRSTTYFCEHRYTRAGTGTVPGTGITCTCADCRLVEQPIQKKRVCVSNLDRARIESIGRGFVEISVSVGF